VQQVSPNKQDIPAINFNAIKDYGSILPKAKGRIGEPKENSPKVQKLYMSARQQLFKH
jgi:hypothetical protein